MNCQTLTNSDRLKSNRFCESLPRPKGQGNRSSSLTRRPIIPRRACEEIGPLLLLQNPGLISWDCTSPPTTPTTTTGSPRLATVHLATVGRDNSSDKGDLWPVLAHDWYLHLEQVLALMTAPGIYRWSSQVPAPMIGPYVYDTSSHL